MILAGMQPANLRLQPWRYLFEAGRGLALRGYAVTLLTDGGRGVQYDNLDGLPLVRLPGVRNFSWKRSGDLEAALKEIHPQTIIWPASLTGFVHQDYRLGLGLQNIGYFANPIYTFKDLAKIGIAKLYQDRRLSAIHLLGALIPRSFLRKRMRSSGLHKLVVQTQTTQRLLLDIGLWETGVEVIRPGVDEIWYSGRSQNIQETRRALGFNPGDNVVVYFGSPAPLRGLPLLLEATAIARRSNSSLRLLVLSRIDADEPVRKLYGLEQAQALQPVGRFLQVVNGFLPIEQLVQYVNAADIVALPFELVPSDAPLSLLEAHALGKPLVTTRLSCLPELASQGRHYLAAPSDPQSLAGALLHAAQDLAMAEPKPGDVTRTTGDRIQPRGWDQVGAEWADMLERL